jgi:hypothetical protein
MKRLLVVAALVASPAHAGAISKFESKPVAFSGTVSKSLEDIERCLIDELGKYGPANVYRQPDRPDDVTITWTSRGWTTIGRLDLKRDARGTKVTSWMEEKDIRPCL